MTAVPQPARSGQPPQRSCLVAVDTTGAGVEALVWALRYAADHDMDLEVLTVWPAHDSVLVHEVPGHFCAPRWVAGRAQADAVREATEAVGAAPGLKVTLENADAAEAIVRASRRHDLIVLGSASSPGPHRLTDLVIQQSSCDVVVVDSRQVVPHPRRGRQRSGTTRP